MAQIKKTKIEDKQIAVIQTELSPIVTKARSIVVTNQKTMEQASLMLSELNKKADMIDEEKQKVLAPLNTARTAEINRWKPVLSTLETATEYLRSTISSYQTAEVKRVREEEIAIANRVGEGKGKLKVETAVKQIENIDTPDHQVATEAGLVKFREDKVLKITDETKIPREYLVINEKKLLEALKGGVTVAGAELDIKMVPVNFR
jgi:hypothetical protein